MSAVGNSPQLQTFDHYPFDLPLLTACAILAAKPPHKMSIPSIITVIAPALIFSLPPSYRYLLHR